MQNKIIRMFYEPSEYPRGVFVFKVVVWVNGKKYTYEYIPQDNFLESEMEMVFDNMKYEFKRIMKEGDKYDRCN